MMMNEDPTKEDIDFFRESVGPIKRVRSDRVLHPAPKPPPYPEQRLLDEALVIQELANLEFDPAAFPLDEAVSFSRPGMQKSVLRKLKRGHYRIGAELDLHGLTLPLAQRALNEFFHQTRKSRVRCVRIIHGKGRQSSNYGPVLKPLTYRWLRQRDEVLAFCSARQVDGGTGAVYVLLRNF